MTATLYVRITLIKEQEKARQDDKYEINKQEQQESHEWVVIPNTDAVVYPGAMMVEALYTGVADRTVTRTRCPNYLAVGAKFTWVNNLQQMYKVE